MVVVVVVVVVFVVVVVVVVLVVVIVVVVVATTAAVLLSITQTPYRTHNLIGNYRLLRNKRTPLISATTPPLFF